MHEYNSYKENCINASIMTKNFPSYFSNYYNYYKKLFIYYYSKINSYKKKRVFSDMKVGIPKYPR